MEFPVIIRRSWKRSVLGLKIRRHWRESKSARLRWSPHIYFRTKKNPTNSSPRQCKKSLTMNWSSVRLFSWRTMISEKKKRKLCSTRGGHSWKTLRSETISISTSRQKQKRTLSVMRLSHSSVKKNGLKLMLRLSQRSKPWAVWMPTILTFTEWEWIPCVASQITKRISVNSTWIWQH